MGDWKELLKKNKKYIFWLAYVVYLTELILFSSMYGENESLQAGFALIRNISYLLVCFKIFLDFLYGGYNKKEICLIAGITLLLLITAKQTHYKAMLIYWFFIVSAHDIELEKIVKVSLFVHFACMFIIILSSVKGIIEDRIYSPGARNRSSLGYVYTTDSSNYFFHMILMYVYVKKEKISWESIGALMLCNLLIYQLTDTKNSFYMGLFVLIVAALWKMIKVLRKNNLIYKLGSVFCVPILASVMMYLTFCFDRNIPWMVKIDQLITGRLQLGYNGYKNYGIHLWGKAIEWVGGTIWYTGEEGVYNYVDSSYIQILLNFGILVFVLICLLFVLLGYKAAKKNDIYLSLVLLAIAVHSAIDPQLVWMAYNPFIMCYYYIYSKDAEKNKFTPDTKPNYNTSNI